MGQASHRRRERRMETGEVRCGLVCGCRGDSRVKDVLVSHCGDRGHFYSLSA